MGSESNGRVDVSVLIPVLNEERAIRDSVLAMLGQQFDGEIEYLFMDGASEDRTKAILEEMAAHDHRIRVLDNPQQRTTFGLNIGLQNARGDYVVRMDAHTHYPAEYVAKGVERLARADGVEWVTGPQIPNGTGKWSRRVAIALRSWFGAGGSSKWEAEEEKDIDTGVFTGVWRRTTLDEYGGWDDGWPVNQDSELAARFFERGSRIVCMPELGALYTPRDSLKSLAQAVLALRLLPRQDQPLPPFEHAPLGRVPARARARAPRRCAGPATAAAPVQRGRRDVGCRGDRRQRAHRPQGRS